MGAARAGTSGIASVSGEITNKADDADNAEGTKKLSPVFMFSASSAAYVRQLLAFNGLCVNFNPGDVGPSTLAVAASRHEVRESDFIDSAQIR